MCVVVQVQTPSSVTIPGFSPHERPLYPIEVKGSAALNLYKTGGGATASSSNGRSLPFHYLAYAFRFGLSSTVSSVQGLALPGGVVIGDIFKKYPTPHELLYVALTRALDIQHIWLTRVIGQHELSKVTVSPHHFEEETRLTELVDATQAYFDDASGLVQLPSTTPRAGPGRQGASARAPTTSTTTTTSTTIVPRASQSSAATGQPASSLQPLTLTTGSSLCVEAGRQLYVGRQNVEGCGVVGNSVYLDLVVLYLDKLVRPHSTAQCILFLIVDWASANVINASVKQQWETRVDALDRARPSLLVFPLFNEVHFGVIFVLVQGNRAFLASHETWTSYPEFTDVAANRIKGFVLNTVEGVAFLDGTHHIAVKPQGGLSNACGIRMALAIHDVVHEFNDGSTLLASVSLANGNSDAVEGFRNVFQKRRQAAVLSDDDGRRAFVDRIHALRAVRTYMDETMDDDV